MGPNLARLVEWIVLPYLVIACGELTPPTDESVNVVLPLVVFDWINNIVFTSLPPTIVDELDELLELELLETELELLELKLDEELKLI